jgi:hypothetical protein
MGFLVPMPALDSLLGSLRGCLDRFPDKRRGMNTTYGIGDIGMAAFSVFFMQSSSFLAHQRRLQEDHGRSNGDSLFGLTRIPSDNHIRTMLDPAEPNLLHPVYATVLHELEQSGGLDDFRRLGDHVLIALDGTQYFCAPARSTARSARRGCAATAGPNISTPCSAPLAGRARCLLFPA